MAKYTINDTTLVAIADAIRAKSGTTGGIDPANMAALIEGIQTGSDQVIEPLTVTENGTYEAPDGVDGYNPVTVNVAASGGSDDSSFKDVIERTAVNPTLPSDLTSIGDYAFYSCTNLALTSLPAGVTSIGKSAFFRCFGILQMTFPESITAISANAFNNCYKMTEVTFKGEPTTINGSAFANCTAIETINVPWAEGEVANAPWGATNATINYNYVEEG